MISTVVPPKNPVKSWWRNPLRATSQLQAALWYQSMGIAILPISPNGSKAPLLQAGWNKDPVAGKDTITTWWSRWPDAYIGIRLALSHLVVVDCDDAQALEQVHALGIPGGVPQVQTPRGHHFYFRNEGNVTIKRFSKWKPNLDIFSSGYVIAPPSSGYKWLETSQKMTPPPIWVCEALTRPRPGPAPPAPQALEGLAPKVDRVRAALSCIDSGCGFEDWIRVLCALKNGFGEKGFDLFHDWSSGAPNYKSQSDCFKHWKSKKANPRGKAVRIETIYWMARQNGWSPPPDNLQPSPTNGKKVKGLPVSTTTKAQDDGLGNIQIGNTDYTFGQEVWKSSIRIDKNGETGESKELLAREIYPICITQDVDTHERGLLVGYKDKSGSRQTYCLGGESWVTTNGARNAATTMAARGMEVQPLQGFNLVIALGWWASTKGRATWNPSVRSTGWRIYKEQWVFTTGTKTYGCDFRWNGSPETRASKRGHLDKWKNSIGELARGSKAICLTLAVAFGASLIEPLSQGSYMVHLFGGSSTGKTIATMLAQSIWGNPQRPASWKDTGNYLLENLPEFSGKCLVVDDLRKAGRPAGVATLILALSDNLTKGRLSRTGEIRPVRRFALTSLSNGEQSMAAFLGKLDDVGHAVRCIDLPISIGESTLSRTHAKQCERWCASGSFGVAGPAWAEWLVKMLADKGGLNALTELVDFYMNEIAHLVTGSPTNERIAYHLCIAIAAQEFAQRAKVLPLILKEDSEDELKPIEILKWAIQKVVVSRGEATSPEARTLVELLGRLSRCPAEYPTASSFEHSPPNTLGGIHDPDTDTLYVTKALIKPLCEATRVHPRIWLEWLVNEGLSTHTGKRFRLNSSSLLNQRWHVIDLAKAKNPSGQN